MKKTLVSLLAIAFIATCVLSYSNKKISEERDRYKANQTALLADVEHYKTESGLNAASVQKLTLSYDELKKNYDDVVKTAKDLDIKLKRIQSVATAATKTEVIVKTVVRDSVVYLNGNIERLTAFKWSDAWVDIDGEIEKDSVTLDVCSRDTLVQIVHRVPHKFWFIKWGTKAIRQEIVSKNPHTQITYNKLIELK